MISSYRYATTNALVKAIYLWIWTAELLTKSLRLLPEKHKGLIDTEQRYRRRYVDLTTNEHSRDVFRTRSKIIQGIGDYFLKQNFMEIETRMLQVIPSGATARPLVTHHNALDIDMYLHIAPELYLKRVVIGGFERLFEINRNFRNDSLSTHRNPEFTMIEFYQAYADYNDVMDLYKFLFMNIILRKSNYDNINDTARWLWIWSLR